MRYGEPRFVCSLGYSSTSKPPDLGKPFFYMDLEFLTAQLADLNTNGVPKDLSIHLGEVFSSVEIRPEYLGRARLYELYLRHVAGKLCNLPESTMELINRGVEIFDESLQTPEGIAKAVNEAQGEDRNYLYVAMLIGILCYTAILKQGSGLFAELFVKSWCAYFSKELQ